MNVHRNPAHGNEGELDMEALGPLQVERLALEQLFKSTQGYSMTRGKAGWINARNWCSEKPVQMWYGVEVNSKGEVVRLDVGNNNLVGGLMLNQTTVFIF